MKKLTSGQINILRLAKRDAKEDGWTKVSRVVWPIITGVDNLPGIPEDLLDRRPIEGDGGFVRVTAAGDVILQYA